ncbi:MULTISPECIES: TnsD family Tn7-like transposition protein [Paenibacillus]|nr:MULTISPECIES: TnsD family Tn7-like transposition protein [Paenibacillus]OMF65511.1 hypothetical protein BK142_30660 [Paenibacillus glucanolyticus]
MSRIQMFPSPYPDEELRSLIYRYVLRKGCSYIEGIQELMGINSRRVPFLPHNLEVLQRKVPSLFPDSDTLLLQHTFYPFFAAFLSDVNRDELRSRMIVYRQGEKYATVLIPPIISKDVRYCTQCITEDEERFGEVYIHRSHQIGSIDVCHKHRCVLISQCPECEVSLGQLYGTIFLGSTHCPNGHELSGTIDTLHQDEIMQLKLRISKDVYQILNGEIKIGDLFYIYNLLAREMGYQHPDGRYMNQKFHEKFLQRYSPRTLEELGLIPDLLEKRSALQIFSEKNAIRNPIVHMLVLDWLIGGYGQLHKYESAHKKTPIPFGNGPWPCINKVCAKYAQNVITSNKQHYCYSTKRIRGRFLCKHCKMEYRSSCVDGQLEFDFATVKVVEYGPLWHEQLVIEYNKGKSMNNIAASLGANRSTIKKYLLLYMGKKVNQEHPLTKGSLNWIHKLYLTYDQTQSINETSILLHTSKSVVTRYINEREKYEKEILPAMKEAAVTSEVEVEPRAKLMELLERFPGLSRSDLRKIMGSKILSKLMKEEGNGLENILPLTDHPFKSPLWEEEDTKLMLVIKEVCQQLYKNPPNKQIKRYTILNLLSTKDKARIIRYSEKLPRSTNMLDQYLESTEHYQLRMIPHTVALHKKHYGNTTLPMILSSCRYKNCSQQVQLSIQEYLRSKEL